MTTLFTGQTDGISCGATEIFALGLTEQREERTPLDELETALSGLLGDSLPPPPARYWTEDQTIRFHGGDYRIVTRLGSGGVGATFKVVEIDRATGEELGTYVAKIAHESGTGQRVLRSYGLARSYLGRHKELSPIHEFSHEWQENEFIALLGWIEGTPLSEFTGVLELVAEEQNEPSGETVGT